MMRTLTMTALAVLLALAWTACSEPRTAEMQNDDETTDRENYAMSDELPQTEEEWRARLTDQEFHILRKKGTEPSGTSELLYNKEDGTYVCAGCGQELFPSEAKYKSGTGWPSFYEPVADTAVKKQADNSLFMKRTEVVCARCGGHLGHVFDDGPQPTGLRYCINGAALDFEAQGEE